MVDKSFKVLDTNHTSFTVSSLDRSVAFFCDGLGFKLESRAPRDPKAAPTVIGVPGARLEVAHIRTVSGHRLELIEFSGPAERHSVNVRVCDPGSSHMAFDVDDIFAVIEVAKQHGFTPLSPKPVAHRTGGANAGALIQYLRHSDGFFIEFIQRDGLKDRKEGDYLC
ncbi:MAG: VOC family protein [Steroidobacteraceae bacterium]